MGFLESGEPLTWDESLPYVSKVKRDGISQLIFIFEKNQKNEIPIENLKCGDEIEMMLVQFDNEGDPRLYLGGFDIIKKLIAKPGESLSWHPEFGRHMIESTPFVPYDLSLDGVLVEPRLSMAARRVSLLATLPWDVHPVLLTAFPTFGGMPWGSSASWLSHEAPDPNEQTAAFSRSVFVPDVVINPHPRFPSLVANIRSRRRAKPNICIPIFQDEMTSTSDLWDKSISLDESNRFNVESLSKETFNPVKDMIYMDTFAFGMGQSCLQVTAGCPNIEMARRLYDQWAILAPLVLALTAATPMTRGLLSDYDTRWSTLEQAVDCRMEGEMDKLQKSRYAGVSLFVGTDAGIWNDVDVPIDEMAFERLRASGMDEMLSRHFGYLWMRDPVVIFNDKIDLDNKIKSDHFENIQSTNWNSVRFKPPPPTADGSPSLVGWRVELRTPEIQPTEFENAAIVGFCLAFALAVMSRGWEFYVPVSKIDENMRRSWRRDSLTREKFWWSVDANSPAVEMTADEIFAGTEGWPGLVTLLSQFVCSEHSAGRASIQAVQHFSDFSRLILGRVSGKLPTPAASLRQIVVSHSSYQKDSKVPKEAARDICRLACELAKGSEKSDHTDRWSPVASTGTPTSPWESPKGETIEEADSCQMGCCCEA